jgi:hypothetical protein
MNIPVPHGSGRRAASRVAALAAALAVGTVLAPAAPARGDELRLGTAFRWSYRFLRYDRWRGVLQQAR